MLFNEIQTSLHEYWADYGCTLAQPTDIEVGAGTFNPHTFLKSLGPDPYDVAYVEPCRRPADGRYGENPNRLGYYYQYQVILKPAPDEVQDLYLRSLLDLGIDPGSHDIRFVEDDWESPTLGAWGLGWEIWLDGMEITQFTYFQQVGGQDLDPVCVELTYGLERIAMYLQDVDNVFDIQWNERETYGDIHHESEREYSAYFFETARPEYLREQFGEAEQEVERCLEDDLVIPAYDYVMKLSHLFNSMEARGVLSVAERTNFVGRVRGSANAVAEAYLRTRYPEQYGENEAGNGSGEKNGDSL
ncbi:MAG: glycine--tRNA ligase subunit alpha [bacterium]